MVAYDIAEMVAAADLLCLEDRLELADALEECGRGDEAAELRTDSPAPLVRNCGQVCRLLQIDVSGRRWFQRTYGNTYHTARLWVTLRVCGRERVVKLTSGITYGYGSQYQQTANELLLEALPDLRRPGVDAYTPLRVLCDEWDVIHHDAVYDVRRQRDL